jgi:hypothetical protein
MRGASRAAARIEEPHMGREATSFVVDDLSSFLTAWRARTASR